MKNYYEVLEIPINATHNDIRSAYKKKSLQYHPDKNLHNQDSTYQFQKINQAYTILINSVTRKKYDEENKLIDLKISNINEDINFLWNKKNKLNFELNSLQCELNSWNEYKNDNLKKFWEINKQNNQLKDKLNKLKIKNKSSMLNCLLKLLTCCFYDRNNKIKNKIKTIEINLEKKKKEIMYLNAEHEDIKGYIQHLNNEKIIIEHKIKQIDFKISNINKNEQQFKYQNKKWEASM